MTPRLEFELEPRAPFRLDLTAWALRRQAHNAIDRWDGLTYQRAMSIDGDPVTLSVSQVGATDQPQLSVLLAGGSAGPGVERSARSALERLLGLSVDLSEFAAMAASDPMLRPLAERLRGLRPPRFPTVFEALVNGVACQQLSLPVGIHLLNRLAAHADELRPATLTARTRSRTRARSPPSSPVSSMATASAWPRRARSLRRRGRASAGRLDLEGLDVLDDADALARLTSLRGIGRWTAEYVLLRGLGRLHVFPGDDVGAHNKLRRLFALDAPLNYDTVQQLVARWHPYAGFVYFHLLVDSLSRAGLVGSAES